VGVPTVIDMSVSEESEREPLMLVPRDIDRVIARYAKTISAALNRALNPELTEAEIEELTL